jgi:hypothetical protein
MGYKYCPETNDWKAWYCERNPKTRVPKTLRKKGLKTEAEAKRAERELVVRVRNSFVEAVVPTWTKLVSEFRMPRGYAIGPTRLIKIASCALKHIRLRDGRHAESTQLLQKRSRTF